MEIINLFLQLIYFSLPIYISNMTPVLVKKVDFLSFPIDFGIKWKGNYLFGKTKTVRGIFFGTVFGIITVFLQYLLYNLSFFNSISIISYQSVSIILLGFSLGFGAMFGDLIESFFKRRLDMKSGERFFPFDQIDFVIGSMIFSYVFLPNILYWALIIFISPFLHILANYIGYFFKMQDSPW